MLYQPIANLDFPLVNYRGTALALIDIRAGTVDFMFADMPATMGQVRDGALQALAVNTAQRVPALPDVRARVSEVGLIVAEGSDVATAHMRSEAEKWSALIRAKGLRFDE